MHSLLWMKNKSNDDAPNFWIDPSTENMEETKDDNGMQKRIKEIEMFADFLISTSPEDLF